MEKKSSIGKIVKIYNHLEEYLLVVLLFAMVVIVFQQVIARFVFNNSLSWSEEVARMIFIWMSWLGISYGQKKGEHIKIVLLVDHLKGMSRKIVLVIADMITLAILGIFCYEGIFVVEKIMEIGSRAASVSIPNWIIYASVPTSCLMMGIRVSKEMIDILFDKNIPEVN